MAQVEIQKMTSRWPKDNQAALKAFYGNPATDSVAQNLVSVTPPFKMYYEGQRVAALKFHRKAAPALLAALNKAWDYYGNDQAIIDKLGISKTAGTYNRRLVRGSKTNWSNHAFGAAIDINAEENGLNTAGNIPPVLIAAFKSEGARWGGDYSGRKDPMHFEFCDNGQPDKSFEEWLHHYGVSERVASQDESDNGVILAASDGIGTAIGFLGTASDAVSKVTTAREEIKPLVKSRISWGATALGATSSATAIASAPPSLWDKFIDVWKSPIWWLVLLNIALTVFIIYRYWRDHGFGLIEKRKESQ